MSAIDGKQVEGGRSDRTHSNRGESVAQAEQQHIGLHPDEYTHTHTHTCSVASRTAGRNVCVRVCVCQCLRAFHLMHVSAFARAGLFAFVLSFATVCAFPGECVRVCTHLRLCKYVCAGGKNVLSSLQTVGVCVYLRSVSPLVWRQEVEEGFGGRGKRSDGRE